VTGLGRDTARDWIERWDRQQEESLPDREDRFTALIDALDEATDPRHLVTRLLTPLLEGRLPAEPLVLGE